MRVILPFAPDGLAAIYEIKGTGASKMHYIYTDHLGSYNVITDANGAVEEQLSFDAWGRRRNPTYWTYYASGAEPAHLFDRGFTGHEHLDVFNLINMNGRVYDPIIARFLSPDNYTQNSTTQGLNRYSYCLNNPLAYTDPSGYTAYGSGSGGGNDAAGINHQLQMDWFNWMSNTSSFAHSLVFAVGADNNYGTLTTFSNSGMVVSTSIVDNGTYAVYNANHNENGTYIQTSGTLGILTQNDETIGVSVSEVYCAWVPVGATTPAWSDIFWQTASSTYIDDFGGDGFYPSEKGSNKSFNQEYEKAWKLYYQKEWDRGIKDAVNSKKFYYPESSSFPLSLRRSFWFLSNTDKASAGWNAGFIDSRYYGYVRGYKYGNELYDEFFLENTQNYDPVSPTFPSWYENLGW